MSSLGFSSALTDADGSSSEPNTNAEIPIRATSSLLFLAGAGQNSPRGCQPHELRLLLAGERLVDGQRVGLLVVGQQGFGTPQLSIDRRRAGCLFGRPGLQGLGRL